MIQGKTFPKKLGRRILSLLLVLTMLLGLTMAGALAASVDGVFMMEMVFSGSGTESDPYQISSEADLIALQELSNGEGLEFLQSQYSHGAPWYFKLADDIALTGEWTPIAADAEHYFAGVFDGGGHTISGLNVSVEKSADSGKAVVYAGLFGYVQNGRIQNLTVAGTVNAKVTVTSPEDGTASAVANNSEIYAGGVAAYATGTTLTNCSAGALTVNAVNEDKGSNEVLDDRDKSKVIVAHGDALTIAGGVAGYMDGGTAANCSASGGASVRSATEADGNRIITIAGGVIGQANAAAVSGCSSSAAVTLKGSPTPHEQLTTNSIGYAEDFLRYWASSAGGVVGAATAQLNIEIGRAGAGAQAGNTVTITMEKAPTLLNCTSAARVTNETKIGVTSATAGTNFGGVAGAVQYAAVSGCKFSGSVNGGESAFINAGGIIGCATGDNEIKDCTLLNGASVSSTSYSGGIAGRVGSGSGTITVVNMGHGKDSVVSNCKIETGTAVSGATAGGIVGCAAYGKMITGCGTAAGAAVNAAAAAGGIVGSTIFLEEISGCSSAADINSTGSTGNAGGVVGVLGNGGSLSSTAGVDMLVENCSNSGPVTSANRAGGIVSHVYTDENALIKDCTNSGTITSTYNGGKSTYAYPTSGGIVSYLCGYTSSKPAVVDNCVNTGLVTALYGGGSIGGIAATVYYGVVRNSVNTGSVSVAENGTVAWAGGIAGTTYLAYSVLLNSYNTGSVSGGAKYTGGIVGYQYRGTVANNYNSGAVQSGAGAVGAAVGFNNSTSAKTSNNLFALTGTAENLVGAGTMPENISFFSTGEDGTLTLGTASTYGGDLLSALDAYVRTKVDGVCLSWTKGSDGMPVLGSEIPNKAVVPTVPTFRVNGAEEEAAGCAVNNNEPVTIGAFTDAGGDTIFYQWYESPNRYSSYMEEIEGAAGQSYIFSSTQPGVHYLFVEVYSSNSYDVSEKVLGGPFAVTVKATEGDTAWYAGTVEAFQLQTAGEENSASNPYIIDTPAKLAYLAQQVNAGTSYEGVYFRQTADLDLNRQSWTPVGSTSAPFKGIYDGGGKKIENLVILEMYDAATAASPEVYGLFGSVDGGTVKNLTVSGTISYACDTAPATTYNVYMGGIAGQLVNNGVIENCTVMDMAVTSTHNGDQKVWLPSSGGIVGYVNAGKVSGCTTAENVTVTGPTATAATAALVSGMGGIAGYTLTAEITNCSSAAAVTGQNAGGIVGRTGTTSAEGTTISQVTNTGAVSGVDGKESYTGGLVGYLRYSTLDGGTNSGAVCSGTGSFTSVYVGGLVGYSSSNTLRNGKNTGTVTNLSASSAYIGGVAAYSLSDIRLSDCTNSGTVSGTAAYTGGLVGYLSGSNMFNSANTGAVTSSSTSTTSYAGGLTGYSAINIYNCYNTGAVSGTAAYAGGLVGYLNSTGTLSNCYNTGAVSGSTAGSLAGRTYANTNIIVSNCYSLAQDGLEVIGTQGAGSMVASIGSIDGVTKEVTAVSGYPLEYTGDLLNLLNSWAVSHKGGYDGVVGWKDQEDGYPTWDETFDLNAAAAAAPEIQMSNMALELNESGCLKAEISVAAADGAVVGTVSYQWYKDGAALEDEAGSGVVTLDENGKGTVSLDIAAASRAGSTAYRLEVINRTQYSYQKVDANAAVKVNKAEGDISWYGDASEGFAGGAGTAANPYLISDADQLAYLAQQVNSGVTTYADQYIKLTADMELNDFPWTPIGSTAAICFSGTFDGDGHTISGLNVSGFSNGGLFGAANGAIKNVVVSGSVTGSSRAAGLVAYTSKGLTLENCGNEASVTGGGGAYVGGLLAYSYGSRTAAIPVVITGCYNTGDISQENSTTAGDSIGGIVGYSNYTTLTVTDCYNTGTVISGKGYAGGIVGYVSYSAAYPVTLLRCYDAGTVTGTTSAALVGQFYSLSAVHTVETCYYLTDASDAGCKFYYTTKDLDVTPCTAAELAALAGKLGEAWTGTTAGAAVTFTGANAAVQVNGEDVAMGTAVKAAGWPALSWQKDPVREAGALTFTVAVTDGYELDSVTVNGEFLAANENGVYELNAGEDVTVVISTKKGAALSIEQILDSLASGTNESVKDEETGEEISTGYDAAMDFNNDGKNDLLDILDILYWQKEQSAQDKDETPEEGTEEEEVSAAEAESGVSAAEAESGVSAAEAESEAPAAETTQE